MLNECLGNEMQLKHSCITPFQTTHCPIPKPETILASFLENVWFNIFLQGDPNISGGDLPEMLGLLQACIKAALKVEWQPP